LLVVIVMTLLITPPLRGSDADLGLRCETPSKQGLVRRLVFDMRPAAFSV
jgi:hypothetical protein